MKKTPEKTCDDLAHITMNAILAVEGILKVAEKRLKNARADLKLLRESMEENGVTEETK